MSQIDTSLMDRYVDKTLLLYYLGWESIRVSY